MFVCICHQVTDKQIHNAVFNGMREMDSITSQLKVGTCCGKCRECASKVLSEAIQQNPQ